MVEELIESNRVGSSKVDPRSEEAERIRFKRSERTAASTKATTIVSRTTSKKESSQRRSSTERR